MFCPYEISIHKFFLFQRKPRPAPLRPGIPDLLSLPLPLPNPLDFLNNPTPTTGLFANLLPFNEVPVSASSSGPKISPIQGFRVEIRNLQPSVTLDDVFVSYISLFYNLVSYV